MNKRSKDLGSNDTLNPDENKISHGGVFEKEDIVLFNLIGSKDYETEDYNEESEETPVNG